MTAVLAIAGWSLYALVDRSLVGEVDQALTAKARMLASTVEQQARDLHVEFADFDMPEYQAAEHGAFLQLSLARGDVLYRSPSLGERTLELGAIGAVPTFAWIDMGPGIRGRQITLPFQPELADAGTPPESPARLALVLARDASDVDRALASLRARLVSVGLATLAVAAAVLVWVVRRSVRPITVVATNLAAIGEDDLSTRLELADVPTELVPVVQRANELLARLEAAFARERAFSDDVAHELRTPLAGLRATLEVTGARPRSEAEYARAVSEGTAMVDRMQAMVERLLQLARLETGPPSGESQSYEAAELVVEAWEPFAARAQARGLRVDLELEHGLGLSLNRELVGLILRNLHENAVAYADAGGRVRITLQRSAQREIRVAVANTGSRLSQEQASAATLRFWRGNAARADAGLHCGLGLALADKAARTLGGELKLSSRVDGEFVAELGLPADGAARNGPGS